MYNDTSSTACSHNVERSEWKYILKKMFGTV